MQQNDAAAARWVATLAPWEPESRVEIHDGTARSPLISTTAQITVAFDGSLHNRADLARQLAPTEHAGDADLVRLAYERWGLDVAARLKGVFALCIADAGQRRLVLARDPLGAWPLYYAEVRGRFIVSTSVHALREQPGVGRAFNRAVIADHVSHRWTNQRETFFEAIHRLQPGHILVSSADGTSTRRYWDPVPDRGPVAWVSADDVLSEFEKTFACAVERALDSGPAAIFLSGGLDSISVAAMAVDVLGGIGASRLHALSLGFPDQDSEEFEQRAVAKSLGLEHEFVPFYDAVPGRMLEATLAHVRGLPAPLLNPWTPAYAHLAMRARRWGTRVILTGHGGDEWLGVSPFLSADLMRAGDLGRLLRFFASHRRSCNIPTHRAMRTIFWQFGLRPVASSLLERAAPRAWTARRTRRSVGGLQSWLAPDPSLRAAIEARVERAMPPATPPRSFYFRDIRQMIEHPLVAMELEESFEMGRRLGFLFARPYWDGDVVDILYRAPPQVLLAGGRSKGVVRATMAKRFPGLGLDRQRKRIATTFFASVVTRQVPDMWRANPTLSGLAGLGIVNLAGVRRMADRAIAKRDRHNLVRLWYLMNTDAWVAAHA